DGIRDRNVTGVQTCALPISGGVQAVMKELQKKQLIDDSLMTVTGKTVKENLETVQNLDHGIIKDIDAPNSKTGGIAVLFGNIAQIGRASCRERLRRSRRAVG